MMGRLWPFEMYGGAAIVGMILLWGGCEAAVWEACRAVHLADIVSTSEYRAVLAFCVDDSSLLVLARRCCSCWISSSSSAQRAPAAHGREAESQAQQGASRACVEAPPRGAVACLTLALRAEEGGGCGSLTCGTAGRAGDRAGDGRGGEESRGGLGADGVDCRRDGRGGGSGESGCDALSCL